MTDNSIIDLISSDEDSDNEIVHTCPTKNDTETIVISSGDEADDENDEIDKNEPHTEPALPVSGRMQNSGRRQIVVNRRLNEVIAFYNTAQREHEVAEWDRCLVEKGPDSENVDENRFKVRDLITRDLIKQTHAYNIAKYEEPSDSGDLKLVSGQRIIAQRQLKRMPHSAESLSLVTRKYSDFYPGFVIEEASKKTKDRFLIIFDDGHAQYIRKCHIRNVFGVNPAAHAHPNGITFLRYNRNAHPFLKPEIGKLVTVELKGKWEIARIIDIDCELLIQLKFQSVDRTEWLLKCSPRFATVWREFFSRKLIKPSVMNHLSVEIVDVSSSSASSSSSSESEGADMNQSIALGHVKKPRRKWITLPFGRQTKAFRPHTCSNLCVEEEKQPMERIDGVKPTMLARPLALGWDRSAKRPITYRTPCGKPLTNIEAVYEFLITTDSELTIDCFTFRKAVDCLRICQTVNGNRCIINPDISNGLEKTPIRVVNQLTNSWPISFEYITESYVSDIVPKYLNDDFLSCCDCTDNCADKEKCSCWRLTLDGLRIQNEFYKDYKEHLGYEYKRLETAVETGIFECNSKCKCSQKKCLNRVAQNPIDHRLELFKTKECGWGVRTLTDIPKGAFIGCYFGEIIDCKILSTNDDEYFAALNFIETATQVKEGFERNVAELIADDGHDASEQPMKRRRVSPSFSASTTSSASSPDTQKSNPNSGILHFFPVPFKSNDLDTVNQTRLHIEKRVTDYVVDGKRKGNIARFINHSCEPNLFSTSVFVETHDLRFPRFAFFAGQDIKAGTELTWDYNYTVDSVPGRVIYCRCGTKFCRKRLL